MGFPKAKKPAAARSVNALPKSEGDFTRLVRVIARQVAKEAFGVFMDTLEARSIQGGSWKFGRKMQQQKPIYHLRKQSGFSASPKCL
jgi:hypothetical protein